MIEFKELNRIDFIDLLKGFAIFSVLLGHSIQYLRNGGDFIHNPVFEFIYSFHMPLFFMISGFFFKSALKLNFKDFVKKKGFQLLLPCFIWTIIFLVISNDFNLIDSIKTLVNPFKWKSWFLRELFISYFLLYIFYKILKIEWLVFVSLIIVVLIVPFGNVQRSLLPAFIVGILLKDNYTYLLNHLRFVLFFSGVLFFLLMFKWNGDYTMYISPFKKLEINQIDIHNILISLFRMIIGISGSIFVFFIFSKMNMQNWVTLNIKKIGTETLSIYLLQGLLLEYLLSIFLDFTGLNFWLFSLVLAPLVSFLMLIVCFQVSSLITKSQFFSLLLFGKNRNN